MTTRRRRNWLLPAGLLLSLASFFSYYFFFVSFPVTRDVPWLTLILFATALVLLGIGLARAYRRPAEYGGRVLGPVLAALGLLVVGFFLYQTYVVARDLPVSARAPAVGEPAPDAVLLDLEGNEVRLASLRGDPAADWTLLVFYRGYW